MLEKERRMWVWKRSVCVCVLVYVLVCVCGWGQVGITSSPFLAPHILLHSTPWTHTQPQIYIQSSRLPYTVHILHHNATWPTRVIFLKMLLLDVVVWTLKPLIFLNRFCLHYNFWSRPFPKCNCSLPVTWPTSDQIFFNIPLITFYIILQTNGET